MLPANGDNATRQGRPQPLVLSFDQAVREARAWFEKTTRPSEDSEDSGYTVADAVTDYLAWYRKRRKAVYEVTRRADIDILPALGGTLIAELTTKQIRQCRRVSPLGAGHVPPSPRFAGLRISRPN